MLPPDPSRRLDLGSITSDSDNSGDIYLTYDRGRPSDPEEDPWLSSDRNARLNYMEGQTSAKVSWASPLDDRRIPDWIRKRHVSQYEWHRRPRKTKSPHLIAALVLCEEALKCGHTHPVDRICSVPVKTGHLPRPRCKTFPAVLDIGATRIFVGKKEARLIALASGQSTNPHLA